MKTREEFFSLDFSISKQLYDPQLSVGVLTGSLIELLLDNESINQSLVDTLYDAVCAFYTKANEYCVEWLHLDPGFIKRCVFVDFFKRNDIPCNYIEKILAYFSQFHETMVNDPNVLILVQDEYIQNQSLIKDKIPEGMW